MDTATILQFGLAGVLMWQVNSKLGVLVTAINGFGKSLQEVATHLTARQDKLEIRLVAIEDVLTEPEDEPIGFRQE